MALRTITYGYEMKDGKITVCASEAEVIEQIYRSYAAGMTFVQIASELTVRTLARTCDGGFSRE